MWYLIVSIPDLCTLTYFKFKAYKNLGHKEDGLKFYFHYFSGLKSSEDELDKMRCVKCNFQAYYDQQYQDHIATHTEDVSKCKCCSYVTFDKDDLLIHFRVSCIE